MHTQAAFADGRQRRGRILASSAIRDFFQLFTWAVACAERNVPGFELVELLPCRVPGYETVPDSGHVVRECLLGLHSQVQAYHRE